MNRKLIGKISLWIQALLYLGAGINHFLNPSFYLVIIPSYLPFKTGINLISGICEIILGIALMVLPKYRKIIVVLIILFLLAILPAHIYHLTEGGCLSNGFCIPIWACWARIFLQFLLMGWALTINVRTAAWSVRKVK
jgi:uncharacterized membrane protein